MPEVDYDEKIAGIVERITDSERLADLATMAIAHHFRIVEAIVEEAAGRTFNAEVLKAARDSVLKEVDRCLR
jgi:hypothetical protein